MVEIIEVKDAVGHSKGDFRKLGLGQSKIWVELDSVESMLNIADSYGLKYIYKKNNEYFFRAIETTHYFKK